MALCTDQTCINSANPLASHRCWECARKIKRSAEDKAFDEIERKLKESQIHPLLNPDSSHYRLLGGIESIEVMEKLFTKDELLAWAKLTWWKYKLRLGQKDATDKELKKMETFKNYYEHLKNG